jgi:hypothetical protein
MAGEPPDPHQARPGRPAQPAGLIIRLPARRLAGAARLGPDRAIRGSGAGWRQAAVRRCPARCAGSPSQAAAVPVPPQGMLQAAVLLIARRQETQAGGADLGQLRPHFGLQPRACPKVPCVRPSESFGGWYGACGSAVSRAPVGAVRP